MWTEKSDPSHINSGVWANSIFYLKKNLMIKFSTFNKLINFNKFTKLRKDFGSRYFEELDDKLIIQHFHHIHICSLTYMIYSSNFSTFKKYITFVFFSHSTV